MDSNLKPKKMTIHEALLALGWESRSNGLFYKSPYRKGSIENYYSLRGAAAVEQRRFERMNKTTVK